MKGTVKAVRILALSGASSIGLGLIFAGPAFAQTTAAAEQDVASISETDSAVEEASDTEGEEIVVTGTSIRGVPPTGSALIGLSRQDIEVINATTTPDLLATIPQLNSFNTNPVPAGGGFGAFAPGLRSLPPSATLVLMNGRRLVSGGNNETNPDYPQIPSLAVQRVEVVADGASSIYGSDAIAGVVNFITRKRYSGVEVAAKYGIADDYHTFSADILAGHDWGSGSILAAYQYAESGNVIGADRDYRVLDFRPYGGVDTRSINCPEANVRIAGILYAAPELAPNTANYCDPRATADLVPAYNQHSAFARIQQDLSSTITAWAEVLYSDRDDTVRVAPGVGTVTLSNTNPFFQAPPGTGATTETVLFRTDNLYGADFVENTDRRKVGNSSVGVDVRLPADFNLTVYGSYNWARNDAYIPIVNPVALAVAAAGTTPATALDPFGTGTSQAVADGIVGNYAVDVSVKQRLYVGAAKIDGPLIKLPAGDLKIAAGAEYRKETFDQGGLYGSAPVPENQEREVWSAFGEIFVPIFGPENAAPFMHSLSLSLSGRYDHYSDFGSTTNPKIGLTWEPIDGVNLRGTYGQSFRAAGTRQVGATVGVSYYDAATAAILLRDPTRGDDQVNTLYLVGGNRGLQPEKAKTYSFGVDIEPKALPGFRASATYYNIKFTDVIGSPPMSQVFNDPTFASLILRDPTNAEVAAFLALGVPTNVPTPVPPIGNLVDLRLSNFGVRETDGIDFDVTYNTDTSFGSFFAGLAGNYILDFDTRLSPAAPISNSLHLGIPRATMRGTAGVTVGSVRAVTFINYRDGVKNTYLTPTGSSTYSADAYTTVDLRFIWDLPKKGLMSGTTLTLQVDNVFDADPPFFPATDGIGGSYNPIGRYGALSLRKEF